MSAPALADVKTYLGESDWEDAAITAALAAEKAAQARRCRVPADTEQWPADLSEALCRRVAANLAARALPLGLQSSISEVGVGYARVGGSNAEVARLEAPYRRVVLG